MDIGPPLRGGPPPTEEGLTLLLAQDTSRSNRGQHGRWEQAVQLLRCVRAGPEIFLLHGRIGVSSRGPRIISWAPCTSAGCARGARDLGTWALHPRNVSAMVVVKGCPRCCFRKIALARAFSVVSRSEGLRGGRGVGEGAGPAAVTRLHSRPPRALQPCSLVSAPRRARPL